MKDPIKTPVLMDSDKFTCSAIFAGGVSPQAGVIGLVPVWRNWKTLYMAGFRVAPLLNLDAQ